MGSGYVLVAIVLVLTIVSIVMWTLPRGEQGIPGLRGKQGEPGVKGDAGTIPPLLTSMMEDTEGFALLQQMIRKPILNFSSSIDRNSQILSESPIVINSEVQEFDIEVDMEDALYTTSITINDSTGEVTWTPGGDQEFKVVYTVTTVYGRTAILARTITVVDTTVPEMTLLPYLGIHKVGSIYEVSRAHVVVTGPDMVHYKIDDGDWIDGDIITKVEPDRAVQYKVVFRATKTPYLVNDM